MKVNEKKKLNETKWNETNNFSNEFSQLWQQCYLVRTLLSKKVTRSWSLHRSDSEIGCNSAWNCEWLLLCLKSKPFNHLNEFIKIHPWKVPDAFLRLTIGTFQKVFGQCAGILDLLLCIAICNDAVSVFDDAIFIGDAITIDQFQLLIETDFQFGQILSAAMLMNAMYRWVDIQCLFDGII